MKGLNVFSSLCAIVFLFYSTSFSQSSSLTYPIVDTGQEKFYNNTSQINAPSYGNEFYGQDAQYNGYQPSYTDNGDGTITDNVTGLMWQQGLFDSKYAFEEVFDVAENSTLAGYNDWRVPTIKEIYSLMLFSGSTGLQGEGGTPYIDTDYFDFRYGDEYNPSERPIDAQYVSSTNYVSTIMNDQPGVFGLNLADGRIKCYPQNKEFELKLVRGTSGYGVNSFADNGDGTITDSATGLMWDQSGSSEGMIWKDALQYAGDMNEQNYRGYNDWRLPNAKELHSLLDYSRSPATTNSAAIDPLFDVPVISDEDGNDNYPFYWTSTTHDDGPNPDHAVYIAFGEALGFMQFPGDVQLTLYDVHGAGAQRSDPKTGNPEDYPDGFGPQGDVIRIYNYVRLVRDADVTTEIGGSEKAPEDFKLEQNYPNPFNPTTTIKFTISFVGRSDTSPYSTKLTVYDIIGNEIATLVNQTKSPGTYEVEFDANTLSSGIYFYALRTGSFVETKRMILLK